MMPTEATLKKYAELAVKVGVNVQKEQPIFINAPIEARLCAPRCGGSL